MRQVLLSLVIALLATPATAAPVHFPSATTPPTPLQQRLARERSQAIEQQPSVKLSGKLYRPATDLSRPSSCCTVAMAACRGPWRTPPVRGSLPSAMCS
jgi:hypothetical protein